ncbi:MAG: dienelactone hydrolase family protein [Jatrophihabitans sp.]|uniref:dienelactone hydrolase family protein n=1 Tax=Jatrophihabitans sp. TaxID=1932789 RepID=UPI003F7FAF02
MAEVLLFHHAQGVTPGMLGLADRLREAGHTVHTPDLFDGRTFDSIESGMAYAEQLGFPDEILARGARATEALPEGIFYVGVSLGVLPAQRLAQTRAGARGAVLVSACVPTEFFGDWPASVPVQIHAMDADPVFTGEGDLEAAQAIVASAPEAELFLYPGSEHSFADASLTGYDAGATTLLLRRVLDFLA